MSGVAGLIEVWLNGPCLLYPHLDDGLMHRNLEGGANNFAKHLPCLLANPDVVLRALGALPSSPNNGPEWENYWYVPKGGD